MEQPVTDQGTLNPTLNESVSKTQSDLLRQLSQFDADSRIQWLEDFLQQLRQLAIPAPPQSDKSSRGAYQDTQEWQLRFGQYLEAGFVDQVTEHFHEAKRRAIRQHSSSTGQ